MRCRVLSFIFAIGLVGHWAVAASIGQEICSPMNGRALVFEDGDYTFLVAGHLYGSPLNRDSVMPASTLLASVDRINQLGAKFFVSLGDNYRVATPRQIENFEKSFVDRIQMPLFNAVGNHDVTNRELYEASFGKTTYHFSSRTELFIFLDTEMDVGRITGPQLRYLTDLCEEAITREDLKSVFIFSHKLLWAVDSEYQIVLDHLNAAYPTAEPFDKTLSPLVRRLAEKLNVYWISGDIGCAWSLPLFYERDQRTGATFVGAGIGETKDDVMLQIRVLDEGNSIEFTPLSLAGKKLGHAEEYDRRYWESHFSAFKDESLLDVVLVKLTNLVSNRKFWAGIVVGVAACGAVWFVRRRRSITR